MEKLPTPGGLEHINCQTLAGDNGRREASDYLMVIAAARLQGRVLRVHGPALHLVAQQARQDIERLEPARTFVAFVEKVEFERSRAGHAAAAVGRGGPVP